MNKKNSGSGSTGNYGWTSASAVGDKRDDDSFRMKRVEVESLDEGYLVKSGGRRFGVSGSRVEEMLGLMGTQGLERGGKRSVLVLRGTEEEIDRLEKMILVARTMAGEEKIREEVEGPYAADEIRKVLTRSPIVDVKVNPYSLEGKKKLDSDIDLGLFIDPKVARDIADEMKKNQPEKP